MRFAACIGSRALRKDEQEFCFAIGKFLVKYGFTIKSGNALGADQSYVKGANSIDPSKVWLYLPWESYNREAIVPGNVTIKNVDPEWFKVASQFHPVWETLSQGARRLHARNVGIVKDTEFVIAFPNEALGGGTAMGMRTAAAYGINVYNLRTKDGEYWQQLIRQESR